MQKVQDRFAVQVPELPDTIDTATYSKYMSRLYTYFLSAIILVCVCYVLLTRFHPVLYLLIEEQRPLTFLSESLTVRNSLFLSHTPSFSHSLSVSISLSLPLNFNLSLYLSLSHSLTHSLSFSLPLSPCGTPISLSH